MKIAAYYLVCLAIAPILSLPIIGMDSVFAHASRSKPYAVVFSNQHRRTVQNHNNAIRIVSMGDSNYFYPVDTDVHPSVSRIFLEENIEESFCAHGGDVKVDVIDWAFVGARMFHFYCLYYEALRYSPHIIIVPINWKWFAKIAATEEYWFPELTALVPVRSRDLDGSDMNPLTSRGISTMKQIEYKAHYYFLFPIGIKAWAIENKKGFFDNPTARAMFIKKQMERKTAVPLPPEFGEEETKSRKRFIADRSRVASRFPMDISESNLTFRDLCALADVASKHGTHVLFYIWPMDREYLTDMGAWDQSAFEVSRERIINATHKRNVHFVDYSGLLQREHFYDWGAHCVREGRIKVGQALAPEIVAILKNASVNSWNE
ncbi:MAG: hypothetical protein C4532_14035 [Candidatus Abyssobacteria bacterium SURF_17]|uniref:Uncharacterized protein n=1 Tax=Candidatus Abyssobacteria bacterium SURF_17 TaxID=2093361 RepID=A0A419EUT3_9BACT|nr:MAG: hypothetical protein C4532_14035 [Candidatus Abyssubacteria bacterium SURF_17]